MKELYMTEAINNEIKTILKDGREINDPNPLFVDVESTPLSLKQQIQRLVKTELSKQMESQGAETFDEADDFDVEEEFEDDNVNSKYTLLEEEMPIMVEEKDPGQEEEVTSSPPGQEEKKEEEKESTVQST